MALFVPGKIGDLVVPNRIVMAPLGRARNHVESREALGRAAIYYAQRATAGFIISEATHVSPASVSRPGTGAIHSEGQVAAWRAVTDAVHQANGRIFQQLFHLGRKADPDRLPGRQLPVAPSAIAAKGTLPTADGSAKPFPVPRALETSEIAELVEDFARAAENARDAGFDGIELHAANGFLIEQFLRDDANQRHDRYGGGVENRARFLLEIVDNAIQIFGAAGVGVRISPHFRGDGAGASDPSTLFPYLGWALNRRNIAYLHLIEPDATPAARKLRAALRNVFSGSLILAGDFTRESADYVLRAGEADFVAFGRLFISNPDLVARFRIPDAPLNEPDEASFYAGGDRGYIDYPALDAKAALLA
ncbi:alkene reductase [Sphingobium yanoikuyae]|uniref:alkene reductase n=1 Tax=Sphingobium yanoikuyae TaxID=13690 RepID=UPI0022DDA2B6|nr:alkene reductase [Sphingobium yanoikuyae]WBQ19432.1 alkene reductase [Sphingobium yanoikuyae]